MVLFPCLGYVHLSSTLLDSARIVKGVNAHQPRYQYTSCCDIDGLILEQEGYLVSHREKRDTEDLPGEKEEIRSFK